MGKSVASKPPGPADLYKKSRRQFATFGRQRRGREAGKR